MVKSMAKTKIKKTKKENKKTEESKKSPWAWLIKIIILVVLYVLLGNAPAIRVNPIVPGAIVAVNMIVIVLAGIFFRGRIGAAVGFFGTLINSLVTGSPFEFAAIIPHTIMGWFAGYIKSKTNIVITSFTIIIGHALNILMYLLTNLLDASILGSSVFWIGITYETIFGIVAIIIIAYLCKLIFMKK